MRGYFRDEDNLGSEYWNCVQYAGIRSRVRSQLVWWIPGTALYYRISGGIRGVSNS